MDTQEFIDLIKWEKFKHAYGVATDAPKELMNLLSNDEDDRDEAINGFLFSSAWHQHSTYSATPYVLKCVLYILQKEDLSSLTTMGDSLVSQLIHFAYVCSRSAKHDSVLTSAVLSGRDLYCNFMNSSDINLANDASRLVDFCNSTNSEANKLLKSDAASGAA